MKLLFCEECYDVFKLDFRYRRCECGAVSGKYVNNTQAEVNGNGFSLAIGNGSLTNAIRKLLAQDTVTDRNSYIVNNAVICWVRPHEGPGNPHTTIKEDVNER